MGNICLILHTKVGSKNILFWFKKKPPGSNLVHPYIFFLSHWPPFGAEICFFFFLFSYLKKHLIFAKEPLLYFSKFFLTNGVPKEESSENSARRGLLPSSHISDLSICSISLLSFAYWYFQQNQSDAWSVFETQPVPWASCLRTKGEG